MQNINGHSQSHRINRSISIPAMVCDDLENPGSFTLPVLRMGVSSTKLRNAQRVPISSLTSSGNSSKSSEPTQESGFSPVLFLTESLNYPISRIFSQSESSPLSLRNLFFYFPFERQVKLLILSAPADHFRIVLLYKPSSTPRKTPDSHRKLSPCNFHDYITYTITFRPNRRRLTAARRPKAIKRPQILPFIVTKHVIIPVVRSYAKIRCVWRVPLVVDFDDIEISAAHGKS